MSLIDKYILEYAEDFAFDCVDHLVTRIYDVEIYIDIFEYNDQHNYREKAYKNYL